MSIIEVSNLSFGYTDVEILRNLSFKVKNGSFLAIAGPNGAGKTTLLNLLCGSLRPKTGKIMVDAAPIESYSDEALAEKVAVVRQEFVPVFGFSVIETVMMSRTLHYGRMGFETQIDRQIVNEALETTDTARFASRLLASLSGGERQRVLIARALAQDTVILLLDEPTSFLDLKHQVGIYDLLKRMQLEKGKTIIAVTHDINLAAQYCDETLLLGGAVFSEKMQDASQSDINYQFGSTQDVFSTERIEKVFGVRTFVVKVGQERFFLPLGKFAKDGQVITNQGGRSQQK